MDPNPASLIAPCTQPAVLQHTSNVNSGQLSKFEVKLTEYSTGALMLTITMTLDCQRADLVYCKYLWSESQFTFTLMLWTLSPSLNDQLVAGCQAI